MVPNRAAIPPRCGISLIGNLAGETTAYTPLLIRKLLCMIKRLSGRRLDPLAIKTGFHMPRKDTAGTWEGHQPATSARLLDVMTTATSGSAKVSRSEKALFTACEFWASARNRNLLGQLSDDAITQLRAAEASFTVIGLTEVAGVPARSGGGRTGYSILSLASALMKNLPPFGGETILN